jgi:hypothetical protein
MTQTGSGSIEALVSLLLVLMVPACRGQSELPRSSKLVLSRIVILADAATAEFDFASTIGEGAAAPISSDRMAFLDAGRNRIVVVDTAGRVIAAFGRQGGGPGEFANPRFLMRTGSGLAVYDGLKFALVNFDLDGRAQADISQTATIGIISGIPTGMAPLADGSWAYSVTEYERNSVRESLYLRRNGVVRRLASTPESPVRVLRLPCGITLHGGPPVYWPTLRWAATPTHVAYAVTEGDRVVIWDVVRADSTVVEGDARPPRATRAAAIAATTGYTVETPAKRCAIEAEAVLEQRGMMKTAPAIERLALAPDGTMWVRVARSSGEPVIIRVHDGTSVDTLSSEVFPGFFLSGSRFVALERDSNQHAVVSLWEVRQRP